MEQNDLPQQKKRKEKKKKEKKKKERKNNSKTKLDKGQKPSPHLMGEGGLHRRVSQYRELYPPMPHTQGIVHSLLY